MALTTTLNQQQLKQNIDALYKAGKTQQEVQGYVDNYTKDPNGNYILKAAPQTPTQTPTQNKGLFSTAVDAANSLPEAVATGKELPQSKPLLQVKPGEEFKASGIEKGGVNLVSSGLYNLATQIANGLNPVKNVKTVVQSAVDLNKALKEPAPYVVQPMQKGQTTAPTVVPVHQDVLQAAKDIFAPIPGQVGRGFIDQFPALKKAFTGDIRGATNQLENNPDEVYKIYFTLKAAAHTTDNLNWKAGGYEDQIRASMPGASEAEINTAIADAKYNFFKDGLSGKIDAVTTEPLKAGAEKVLEAAKAVGNKAKGVFTPDVSQLTPEEIAGKITGAKGSQQGAAARGLNSISDQFKDIKTNEDLSKALQDKATENTNLIDEKLSAGEGADQTYTPKDIKKLTGDDIVKTQIDQLKDVYANTHDTAAYNDISDLEQTYKNNGLTPKEINDLARQYGTEFSDKSFNAKGTPKTNISAKAAENIRAAGKDLARQFMPDEETRTIDLQTSDVLKTKDLVDSMIEKVDNLQNKLKVLSPAQRVAFKLGNTAGKGADILSLGSIKGFLRGVKGYGAPTGMNPIGMEDQLNTNLQLLDKLNNMSATDAAQEISTLSKQPGNMFSESLAVPAGNQETQFLNDSSLKNPGKKTYTVYRVDQGNGSSPVPSNGEKGYMEISPNGTNVSFDSETIGRQFQGNENAYNLTIDPSKDIKIFDNYNDFEKFFEKIPKSYIKRYPEIPGDAFPQANATYHYLVDNGYKGIYLPQGDDPLAGLHLFKPSILKPVK